MDKKVLSAIKETLHKISPKASNKVSTGAHWISVKDRLPEKDDYYFVWAPGYFGKSRIHGDVAISKFQSNFKVHWGIERGCSGVEGQITHWRPIFDSPEDEK